MDWRLLLFSYGNQELLNCQCIFRPDGETTSDRDYCSFFQGESEQQLVKKYDSHGRSNPYFGAFLIAMKSPIQHEASPVNSDSIKKTGITLQVSTRANRVKRTYV